MQKIEDSHNCRKRVNDGCFPIAIYLDTFVHTMTQVAFQLSAIVNITLYIWAAFHFTHDAYDVLFIPCYSPNIQQSCTQPMNCNGTPFQKRFTTAVTSAITWWSGATGSSTSRNKREGGSTWYRMKGKSGIGLWAKLRENLLKGITCTFERHLQ